MSAASIDRSEPVSDPTIKEVWISAFLDYGVYLRGWSDRTCRTYRQGLATLAGVPLNV